MPEEKYTFDPSAEKRRILVVEDELVNQEILKALICDTYEVIQAFTGTEALEIISAQYETLSLILLDLNLPDIQVFYQPKFDVRPSDPVLCSAEALVRWKNVGVAFSDRNKTEGDVFHDADTALERMKEMRTAGYALY